MLKESAKRKKRENHLFIGSLVHWFTNEFNQFLLHDFLI